MSKRGERYKRIQIQLQEIFVKNSDPISRMATINAILYHKMDGFFWVGFYLLKEDRLMAGPYQGPLACLELSKNKGVCWDAINWGKPVVVPDVHEYPGHIACDSRSKSEIVIPLKDKSGQITGVLDIDSNLVNNFSRDDIMPLTRVADMVYQ
jgi:L-methionine (R)-S-oxide reductase